MDTPSDPVSRHGWCHDTSLGQSCSAVSSWVSSKQDPQVPQVIGPSSRAARVIRNCRPHSQRAIVPLFDLALPSRGHRVAVGDQYSLDVGELAAAELRGRGGQPGIGPAHSAKLDADHLWDVRVRFEGTDPEQSFTPGEWSLLVAARGDAGGFTPRRRPDPTGPAHADLDGRQTRPLPTCAGGHSQCKARQLSSTNRGQLRGI